MRKFMVIVEPSASGLAGLEVPERGSYATIVEFAAAAS